jgi:hypothetical protein
MRRRGIWGLAAGAAAVVIGGVETAAGQVEGPPVQLSGDPGGEIVALLQPLDQRRPLYTAVGSPAGFGRPVQLAPPPVEAFDLGGNRDGEAVAAWVQELPDSVGPLMVASRSRNSAFGPPATLADRGSWPLRVLVNRPGDVLLTSGSTRVDDTNHSAWRPSGGQFEPGQPLVANGGSVALDDRGEAVAVWSDGIAGGDGEQVQPVWSKSLRGAPWTPRRWLADPGPGRYPRVYSNGPGLAIATLGDGSTTQSNALVVLSRQPDADSWAEELRIPQSVRREIAVHTAAVGNRGDGVVVLEEGLTVKAVVRAPDGSWSAPETVDMAPRGNGGTHGASWMSAEVDDAGNIAIVYRAHDLTVRAIYRPSGGQFRAMELYRPRGVELSSVYRPGLVVGSGVAFAAWQHADGDRVVTLGRSFGRDGPGRTVTIGRHRQWTREGPRRACTPPGAKTITRTRSAHLYMSKFEDVQGCLFARGVPVGIATPGERGLLPPVAALNSPLAAALDDVYDNKENRSLEFNIVDLRDPLRGVGRDVPIGQYGATAVVLSRRGAIAWVECDRPCRGRRVVYTVNTSGADNKRRRLARGRGIRPTSLKLRGSRLTWTKNGSRRSARLR